MLETKKFSRQNSMNTKLFSTTMFKTRIFKMKISEMKIFKIKKISKRKCSIWECLQRTDGIQKKNIFKISFLMIIICETHFNPCRLYMKNPWEVHCFYHRTTEIYISNKQTIHSINAHFCCYFVLLKSSWNCSYFCFDRFVLMAHGDIQSNRDRKNIYKFNARTLISK